MSTYRNKDATEETYTRGQGVPSEYEEWLRSNPGESSKQPEEGEKDPKDPKEPGSLKNPDERDDREKHQERRGFLPWSGSDGDPSDSGGSDDPRGGCGGGHRRRH